MTSGAPSRGRYLAAWLDRHQGEVLSGVTWSYAGTPGQGKARETGGRSRVQVLGPTRSGGQAAVSRARLALEGTYGGGGRSSVALRVEFAPQDPREFERRQQLFVIADLSRRHRDRYPALVHVYETFQAQITDGADDEPGWSTGGPRYGWCDVMEYCDPLSEVLLRNPDGLGHRPAVALLLPLLATLDALHRDHGLVHRDVDESNVLVAADGGIRIADWGAVVQLSGDRAFTETRFLGKPARVPPELRAGGDRHGPFTDAWMCGRLLALALTGAEPYARPADPGHFAPGVNALPRELRSVVRGLCEADPDARLGLSEAVRRLGTWLAATDSTTGGTGSSRTGGASTRAAAGGVPPRTLVDRLAVPTAGVLIVVAVAAVLALAAGYLHVGPTVPDRSMQGPTLRPTPTPAGVATEPARPVRSGNTVLLRKMTGEFLEDGNQTPVTATGTATGARMRWVRGQLVLEAAFTSLPSGRAKADTVSVGCHRPDVKLKGESQLATGVYLIVAGPPGKDDDGPFAPHTSFWGSSTYATAPWLARPAVCTVEQDGLKHPLDTRWPEIALPASGGWRERVPRAHRLVFSLPTAGTDSRFSEPYPRQIPGFLVITEDRQTIMVPFG